MEVGKLKNIIILILLAVNGVLLFCLLGDRITQRRGQSAQSAEVASVYEARGIALAGDLALDAEAAYPCTGQRDLTAELNVASVLLDSPEAQDLGGNIMAYTGKNGEARFRSSGEFEVWLTASSFTAGGDPQGQALNLAKAMGLSCVARDGVTWDGETAYVTLLCCHDDLVIYNCPVTFTFTVGRLTAVSGRRPPDVITAGDSGDCLGALTALLRFVSITDTYGYVCREVNALEPGWVESQTVSGGLSLTPVWRIGTDTADYYISGLTGDPVEAG